ncbi:MAG: OmpA family protein [Desulfatitalea sp.]|nr:OmpA family protein [Desulfatitalea sp.]
MYLKYFQLNTKPFQITADPGFLWLGEKHKEALATLRYGILDNRGFLLLTGEVGTGKTLLINRLVTLLDLDTVVATLPDPDLVSMDFYNLLADGFNMNRTFDSKGAFLIHLRDFLHQSYADRKQVLLIIDESQRLNHRLMEDIRVLSNIELHDRKLINIFFVGQQEFNTLLAEPENRALAQRITVRYHISPLEPPEVNDYIRHRLKVAGTSREIFTSRAVQEIYQFSGGIPRLINILCDHALLTAYARDTKQVDAPMIKECARELRIPYNNPKSQAEIANRAPDSVSISNAVAKATTGKVAVSPGAGGEKTPAPRNRPKPATRPARSVFAKLFYVLVVMSLVALAAFLITRYAGEDRTRYDAEDLTPQKYLSTLERERASLAQRMAEGEGPTDIVEEEDLAAPEMYNAVDDATPEETTEAASAPRPLEPLPVVGQTITIPFTINSNEIDDASYEVLDRIAAMLRERPDHLLHVRGYTDSSGSASYNESVSRFRANAVKSYLMGKGAPPERIQVFAMGSANPAASNEIPAGRRQNRRVEVYFARNP